MSIATEIERIKTNIANAYTKLSEKGATLPDTQNSASLSDAISTISNNEKDWWNDRTNGNTEWQYLFYKYNGDYLPENINSDNVYDAQGAFSCSRIKELPELNLKNVLYADDMLSYCNNITTVTLDFNLVENCSNMFYADTSLESVTFLNKMPCLENIKTCFFACSKLKNVYNLDISNIKTDYIYSSSNSPLYNLFTSTIIENLTISGEIYSSFSVPSTLTHDSLINIINALATVNDTKTLALFSTNLEKLTDDEKAIAINKGWTLV